MRMQLGFCLQCGDAINPNIGEGICFQCALPADEWAQLKAAVDLAINGRMEPLHQISLGRKP